MEKKVYGVWLKRKDGSNINEGWMRIDDGATIFLTEYPNVAAVHAGLWNADDNINKAEAREIGVDGLPV